MRRYINDSWYFKSEFKEKDINEVELNEFEKIRVPHTVKELPFNYCNNLDYQMTSCYYQEISLKEYKNKKVFLCFDAVAHEASVYLNGKLAIVHKSGYTAFKVLLNDYVDENQLVKVVVKVDSHETLNQPPFGNVIDYLTYGGIYRDTYLDIRNEVYLDDVFVKASMDKSLELNIAYNTEVKDYSLHIKCANIDTQVEAKKKIEFKNLEVELWDVNHPNLYELLVELKKDEEVIDTFKTKVGFRTVSFDETSIYLNNKKIKIRGLNRHQAYPYVGYAMPRRGQVFDAHILKDELGLNAVRTSHYPQSHDFIEECDKIGLLVLTEIPGWQYIGDDEWKKIAINNVKEMILEYRNHPSIFMWGVRINESSDSTTFYKETNRLARSLDDTRLIGGVRCHKNSELFEDVYTFNDFVHDGTNQGITKKKFVTKHKNPLLVTEYNGHMYPTKIFDDEIHRTNHLKRHLRVLSDVGSSSEHAGSFGWCMADYNTHKDFGSGDQICYHGVLDMFRNPKLAAYAYSSQQEKVPVLEINSTLDIGEYPGGFLNSSIVLTNLDKVVLYKNDEKVKTFYPTNEYKGLKHPPIYLDDLVGDLIEKHERYKPKDARILKSCLLSIQKTGLEHMSFTTILKMAYLLVFKHFTIAEGEQVFGKYIGGWGNQESLFKIVGYSGEKEVLSRTIESFKELHFLVKVDETNLVEDKSYDVATVRIEALNQANNHLPYFNESLRLETSGSVGLIGPSIISLKGGMGGTYVKTLKAGSGSLKIYYRDQLIKDIKFNVTKR